jgi:curved DNA-binding protein CbpA
MDNEPLPDHYKALGLDKSCDTEAVKKAHRKLVLGCHPDKIKDTDPLKEQKLSQFHIVQKAYEVLTDPKERGQYEALLTLQALRKEKLARGGTANTSSPREKSARFDVRTAGSNAAFQANTSSRFHTEERRPSRPYDDEDKYYDERDRPRGSTRGSKYDTYEPISKGGSSPRTERESSKAQKATTERSRADKTKARDKEERRDRDRTGRFVSVESDSSSADDKARHEAGYKRRSQEDEQQRRASESKRKDERRPYDDSRYGASSSGRKLSTLEEEALRYQYKSRAQVDEAVRPNLVRASSRDYHHGDQRRSSRKEDAPRRSSAVRPSTKERTSSSSKGYPEIVSWGEEDTSSRRMPTLRPHNSSPANIELPPRATPQRSYTAAETSTSSRDHRSSNSPPPHPSFSRSHTMPVNHSSSRSKPANVSRPSMLRETMTPEHSSPEREYATVPPPKPAGNTTYYRYPAPDAGAHRTVLREPGRERKASPEPLFSRPPIGLNRPSEANIKASVSPGRSGRNESPERGRSEKLYGEVNSSSRPRAVRQSSYTTDNINYAPKYGPEDVRWAPKASTRENDRRFDNGKPQFMRTATTAY